MACIFFSRLAHVEKSVFSPGAKKRSKVRLSLCQRRSHVVFVFSAPQDYKKDGEWFLADYFWVPFGNIYNSHTCDKFKSPK